MYAIDFCPDHTIPLLLVAHKGKHDLNTLDNHGSAALHYACNHGGLPLVQALIAAGADPAQPGGSGRSSPLIIASSNEHADVVQYLLTLPAAKATLDHVDMVRSSVCVWVCAWVCMW
jgi:ankyrin repeat protein